MAEATIAPKIVIDGDQPGSRILLGQYHQRSVAGVHHGLAEKRLPGNPLAQISTRFRNRHVAVGRQRVQSFVYRREHFRRPIEPVSQDLLLLRDELSYRLLDFGELGHSSKP